MRGEHGQFHFVLNSAGEVLNSRPPTHFLAMQKSDKTEPSLSSTVPPYDQSPEPDPGVEDYIGAGITLAIIIAFTGIALAVNKHRSVRREYDLDEDNRPRLKRINNGD